MDLRCLHLRASLRLLLGSHPASLWEAALSPRCDVGTLAATLDHTGQGSEGPGAGPGNRPRSQPHAHPQPGHSPFVGHFGRDCLPLKMGNASERRGSIPGSPSIFPAFSSFRFGTSPARPRAVLPLLQPGVCLPQATVDGSYRHPGSP